MRRYKWLYNHVLKHHLLIYWINIIFLSVPGTIRSAQAQQLLSSPVEETPLNHLADWNDLSSCPPETSLIGPVGSDGTRITVNGRSTAACMRPDGTNHGPSMSWYKNGSKASAGDYHNGVKEGLWYFWHENGQISGHGAFHDGKAEDRWVSFYDNGQKESEGSYINGNQHGDFFHWERNGHIKKTLKYNYGKLSDDFKK